MYSLALPCNLLYSHVFSCTPMYWPKNLELWEFKKIMYSHVLPCILIESRWEYMSFLNSHNSRFLDPVHRSTWELSCTLLYFHVLSYTLMYSNVPLCNGCRNLELWELKKIMYSHLLSCTLTSSHVLSLKEHGSTWFSKILIILGFWTQYIGVHGSTWEYMTF